jgi:hypothetical protein
VLRSSRKSQPKKAFRVKTSYRKILGQRKRSIERRLGAKGYPQSPGPVLSGANIQYEMAARSRAMSYGGIGAIDLMVRRLGLCDEINRAVSVFKRHQPYWESDHVLNIAYNALLGGTRLEDIELRRQDEGYLDALGAERIPDPTTAGDFTRRFTPERILALMEAINVSRAKVWRHKARAQKKTHLMERAYVDSDGTIAETFGGCKGGMGLSYKGIWGYAPLLVSLANTREVIYLVNRPGNAASQEGWATWADRAIELVKGHAEKICLRGDTAFSSTEHFDRWDARGIEFIFGYGAHPNLVKIAESLGSKAWGELERPPKYEITTRGRARPARHKENFVKEKGYKNLKLRSEDVAEIEYTPARYCSRAYRLIIVRKNISVEKGEEALIDEVRYFFYITNRDDLETKEVVALANGRCDQENVIEQLKNGIGAMRMPVDNLVSNWAYMVMSALAWNLKAWLGLMMPEKMRGEEVVRMEYRRFLQNLILIPAQIVRTGRRVVYRLLVYNGWLGELFATWEVLRKLTPV